MRVFKKTMSMFMVLVLMLCAVGAVSAGADEYIPPESFMYSDVDFDGEVTVKDATVIQKGLAELTYLTGVQKYLADPEGEGVSIRTATEIQKFVAGFEVTDSATGTAVDISSADEFSGKVSEKAWFYDDAIYVQLKPDFEFKYEYTLEDFSEYEFKSIESDGSLEKGYKVYKLTLESPSRENVIEAIKSLDYRANLDIELVWPDYYAISILRNF